MEIEIIETYRANSEVYNGHVICKEKFIEFLEKFLFPKGLLPLKDIEEFGYNKDEGFFWIIQKQETKHTFIQINKEVLYAPVVTAFIKKYRLKNISGVKAKEDKDWIPIFEVYFAYPMSKTLIFKGDNSAYSSYLASAFELDEESGQEK